MKLIIGFVGIYLVIGLIYSVSAYIRDQRYVSDLGTRGLLGIGFRTAVQMFFFWPYFVYIFRKYAVPRRAAGPAPEAAPMTSLETLYDGPTPCGVCRRMMTNDLSFNQKEALVCRICGLSVCWAHDQATLRAKPCPHCNSAGLWEFRGATYEGP